jgi:hypothetical protein
VRVLIVLALVMLVWRRGGDWISIALTLSSSPVVALIVSANVDWLLILALLPGIERSLALPLLMIKPQVGLGVALIWLKEQWRRDRSGVLPFLRVTVVVGLVSLLVYGPWPVYILQNAAYLHSANWNTTQFFPFGVPFGLVLLWSAIKREDELLGLTAMFCLTPYMAHYSLAAWYAMLAARFNERKWVSGLVWVVLWGVVLLPYWLETT